MTKNETNKLINILKKTYPDAKCSLDFSTPFELVVAVMLSAQCTDERVNLTTPSLFKRCKTIEDFANIDIKELEEIIHPCGFYRNKAKNIKLCAKQVIENFSGPCWSWKKKCKCYSFRSIWHSNRYCSRHSLQTYFK